MKLGFVFPGQGAQYIGMGKDIFEKYDEVKKIYKKVSDILGVDIAKMTFESSEDILNETKNTQICILTMSLAILELLKQNGISADISAGLSLGEYTSLIYSNVFSFEDGIRIVRKRGELMQDNIPNGHWAMAAVIGLEDKVIEELCSEISTKKYIVPANYNCPGQVVVSGEKEAISILIQKANLAGARKVIELKTTGPFHTDKLQIASEKLKAELDKININNDFSKQVVRNIDAKVYSKDDDIRDILSKHVTSPVRFSESISKMIELGVDTFIEIGPGKVLSGFIKKVNNDVKVMNICDVQTYNEVIERMEE